MSESFVKLIRSEKTSWLRSKYPNAFLLLTLIADRARWKSGNPDGLLIGDAFTDHESAGLSRQEYRTATNKLIEFGMIEIIHNGKKFLKTRKSTINLTIKSMLVNLLDSGICDINLEDTNQPINQLATNQQPTSNHKLERIRPNKKEKDIKESITESIAVSKSVDIRSILSHERKEEEVNIFRLFAESHSLFIPIRDCQIWFSRFLSPYIYEILDLLLTEIELVKKSKGKKKPIKNYLAWMQKALDKNYLLINAQAKKCMEIALHFQQNGWPNLQVRTRYAVDDTTGKDFYYDNEHCEFMLQREYEKVMEA